MKTITIKLTAPLQSYGLQSDFKYRSTNYFPTKSAIIGMVAAALGYKRNDHKIIQLNDLSYAVRLDQSSSILTDFHTVQIDPKKEERKITFRDYIQDAIFMVALGSDNDALIDQIEYALRHPKFQLYLGRRANPPAGPLKTKIFVEKDPVEVLRNIPWQASEWFKQRQRISNHDVNLEIFADADLLPDQQKYTIHDSVKAFVPTNRKYEYRWTAKSKFKLSGVDSKNTGHNIMESLESE